MSISNLFLSVTLAVLFFVLIGDERGTYLEYAQTPLYGIIFTELILIILNKKLKNRLIDIVNLNFIIFFILRIPFIYGGGLISDVYSRNCDIGDVSDALYVLNIQLIILVVCTLLFNPVKSFEKFTISDTIFARVLHFSAVVLMINIIRVLFFFGIGENTMPAIFNIFFAIFNHTSIFIIIVPLLLFIKATTAFKYKALLYIQLLISILIVMFEGNKSGILQIFAIYLVSIIAIYGSSYIVKFKLMVFSIALFFTSIIMFLLGNIFNKIGRGHLEAIDWYEIFKPAISDLSKAINSFSYRIGYLDFYIDKLTQDVYLSAFQVKLYIMAVLDAVSPGFDFFGNVPLASRAVYNNYFGESGGPNSEAITVFAEAHHFAGFFSFITYIFVLSIMFLINKVHFFKEDGFPGAVKLIFIYIIFFQYMLGAGIDYWVFGDVLYPLIGLIVTFKIMRLHVVDNTNALEAHTSKMRP